MDSREFYSGLRALSSFAEATNTSLHAQLPNDWFVVVADVIGSTAAIEADRYKDVNTVGAATVMAVINVDRSTEIPFVFGGDGALLAIPAHMIDGAKKALLGARDLAKNGFNLDLRIAVIPAIDALAQDRWLGVGKYNLSKNLTQTSFSGFGWAWAESVSKDSSISQKYIVKEDDRIKPEADFTGFECRWEPVKAKFDFKLAIIVQSMASNPLEHSRLYDEVLIEISKIFGDASDYHPLVGINRLRLTFDPKKLKAEAVVKSKEQSPQKNSLAIIKLLGTSIIGMMAFIFDLKIMGVRWGKYRGEVIENADFRKFDGALKMLIDAKESQEKQFLEFLEKKRQQGTLVYGLHRSSHAIMTCLVFTPGQDHAHFVDGSEGGYAMAAKIMKLQLQALKTS